jgi:hypothetical protein
VKRTASGEKAETEPGFVSAFLAKAGNYKKIWMSFVFSLE